MVKTEDPSELSAIRADALSSLHQKVPVESDEFVDWVERCSIEASLSPP